MNRRRFIVGAAATPLAAAVTVRTPAPGSLTTEWREMVVLRCQASQYMWTRATGWMQYAHSGVWRTLKAVPRDLEKLTPTRSAQLQSIEPETAQSWRRTS